MPESRTVIIGGGIVGVSAAYYLARRGHAVTVVDDGGMSTSASAGNAGLIAPGHPPLPRPGLVLKTLKWMLDPRSPLYLPPRFDPGLWGWMWRFRRACSRSSFQRSTRLLAELGHLAVESCDEIIADESIECRRLERGWLEVYQSEGSREHGRGDGEMLREAGYDVSELDRDELLEREPAFDPSVIGATHFRDGASLHPGDLLEQIARAARRHGAVVETGAKIISLNVGGRGVAAGSTSGQRFTGDTLVLAAGIWTTGLARSIGVSVPMQPGKGYHVHVPQLDPALTTACVLADRHVAVTPMGDTIRLAGTVELSGLNLRLHPKRVAMLSEEAGVCLPGIRGVQATDAWCGLRPCTADGLPVIGPAPGHRDVFIATGHAKMGLTLGPITGRLLCEWILDGQPSFDCRPFSVERLG